MFLGIEIGGTKLQLGVSPAEDGKLTALERAAVQPENGAQGICPANRTTRRPVDQKIQCPGGRRRVRRSGRSAKRADHQKSSRHRLGRLSDCRLVPKDLRPSVGRGQRFRHGRTRRSPIRRGPRQEGRLLHERRQRHRRRTLHWRPRVRRRRWRRIRTGAYPPRPASRRAQRDCRNSVQRLGHWRGPLEPTLRWPRNCSNNSIVRSNKSPAKWSPRPPWPATRPRLRSSIARRRLTAGPIAQMITLLSPEDGGDWRRRADGRRVVVFCAVA